MASSPTMLARLARILERIEDAILVLLLLTMITLAVLQIVLRNLLDSGLAWEDSLIRVLVLWIGLIGAMAASRTDNHISIDVVSKFLPPPIKRGARLLVHLFTAAISGLMAFHATRFVLMEKEGNLMAFSQVPAWVCESVIPVAFAVISLRYLIFSIRQLGALKSR